jgi:uroporphyrinogen decarboxylase
VCLVMGWIGLHFHRVGSHAVRLARDLARASEAARIAGRIKESHPEVPVIAFPRGAGVLYRRLAGLDGVDALSLDTTVPLAWAADALRPACLQGNLDPIALLVGGEALRAEAERIVRTLGVRPFVFNLGHGVLPETDPDHVAALIDHVRSLRLPLPQERE